MPKFEEWSGTSAVLAVGSPTGKPRSCGSTLSSIAEVPMLLQLGKYWIGLTMLAAVMFTLAGRRDLPMVWAYLCVLGLVATATAFIVTDKGLAEERRRRDQGGSDWSVPNVGPWLMFGHLVIALLDVGRFHWSDIIPLWCQIVGLVGFGATLLLLIWSMAVNRFFSPVVRIQSERGHHVIDVGPYSYVRHPGYAAMLLLGVASPIALGSTLALVPMAAWCGLILRRTLIEDRVLHESLPGYREFAKRVRFRLFPGFW